MSVIYTNPLNLFNVSPKTSPISTDLLPLGDSAVPGVPLKQSTLAELGASMGGLIPGTFGLPIKTISGNYYCCNLVLGNPGTGAGNNVTPQTGTLYFFPIIIPTSSTFTDIAVNCTAGSAGTHAVLGIYGSNSGNNQPAGSPIANSNSTSLSTASTAVADYTFSAAITLSPGVYWCAISTDASTATFAGNVSLRDCINLYGDTSATADPGSIGGWSQSFVYSATLPAVSTLTAVSATARMTYIFLKAQ